MSDAINPDAMTSVEQDGRILTGVGVSADDLAETMERHAPPEPEAQTPKTGAVSEAAAVPESAGGEGVQSKPTRGQRRFSELTHERDEAKARADAVERELHEIKARMAPQAATPPPAHEPARQQPAQQPQFTRPRPTEDEVGSKYASYVDLQEDVARWVGEQQQADVDARIRQAIEADRAAQTFTSHVESTRAKGRAVYKDFDAVLQSGPGGQVQMPQPALAKIYQHPKTEHLQYAILKDLALAQKVQWVAFNDPYAFGALLDTIAPAAPAASSASTGIPGSATPPAPYQPVGSGSTTTRLTSAEYAAKGDFPGYQAARQAERGGRRR